jgi:anti-sigma factor RsiW
MNCPDTLRVHAYFDEELDTAEAGAVRDHIRACASCQAVLADLEQSRAVLRPAPRVPVPARLRNRIDALLDAEPSSEPLRSPPRVARSRPFWLGAFFGVAVSAAAAALVLFAYIPAASAPLVDELLTAHVRSLSADRLIAVVSSEQHTVKPWFAGRADVSPTVMDFGARGFPLEGGRVDELAGARSAVLVYRHGAHWVNVFSWPRTSLLLPHVSTRRGYHLLFWQDGDVAYCAVSDAGWNELEALENLMRAQAAADQRRAPARE